MTATRPTRRHTPRGVRHAAGALAALVLLSVVAVAVTHRSHASPDSSRSVSTGDPSSTRARPAWSILKGVTAVDIASPDGLRTTATDPAQLRQFLSDLNALPLDDGHTRLWKCPPEGPGLDPLRATLRTDTRIVAVTTEGSCGILFSLSVPGHGTVTLMGVSLPSLVYGLH